MRSLAAVIGPGELMRRAGFPHPPYAARLVGSALFCWLALRSVLAIGLVLRHQAAWAPPSARAALVLVTVPVLLTRLDMRILRENTFYRDLGARPFWTVLLPLLAAGAPELAADSFLHACCG